MNIVFTRAALNVLKASERVQQVIGRRDDPPSEGNSRKSE